MSDKLFAAVLIDAIDPPHRFTFAIDPPTNPIFVVAPATVAILFVGEICPATDVIFASAAATVSMLVCCELVGVNNEESRAELSGVLLLQYEFRPS